MAMLPSTGTILIAIISVLFVIEQCKSERVNNVAATAADSRAYTPETNLDFVYHSHDEMTRFLR